MGSSSELGCAAPHANGETSVVTLQPALLPPSPCFLRLKMGAGVGKLKLIMESLEEILEAVGWGM